MRAPAVPFANNYNHGNNNNCGGSNPWAVNQFEEMLPAGKSSLVTGGGGGDKMQNKLSALMIQKQNVSGNLIV